MKKRPPIIVILGHIDHGKTTLLSKIRKHAMPFEHGEITQSIGAFQAKNITFIDTPGHEAFTAMRKRGVQGADIAVIVIAADDGIKTQTKETIQVAKNAKIPIIIAINKVDKTNANPEPIKKEFAKNLIVEVSAKTGQGIDELLEAIKLQADELNLKTKNKLEFYVLESHLDAKRGLSIDIIVKNGKIELGDKIKKYHGKIKQIENWQGQKVNKAEPGMPVRITGLKADKEQIEKIKKQKYLNIIIKAKTQGALEGILHNVQKMPVNILKAGVGNIVDHDVLLKPDLIIGFQVKTSTKQTKCEIQTYNIIYKLLEDLEEILKKEKKPEKKRIELGQVEIIATFKNLKDGMIIGGPVIDGKVVLSAQADIIRKEKRVGQGIIKILEHKNRKMQEVDKGKEAGIYFQGKNKIKINDILRIWHMA